MIKVVSTNLMGGLGNMLFQISAAYNVSLRDNKILICDINNMIVPHKLYSEYQNNIFRKIQFSNLLIHDILISEKGFTYDTIPQIDKNIKLIGYFQSEKYFKDNRKKILELFEMDENTFNYILGKYGNVLGEETCSIHVRRGDYLNLQNHHPTLSIDYYIESIKIIGESKHFLIFSDDIEWCKNNLDFIPNKTFVTENLDYQDLYLMSMCKNNIIANSSFSWWGAWLNNFESKKVIVPKKWFGVTYSNLDTKDLYPENWIKI